MVRAERRFALDAQWRCPRLHAAAAGAILARARGVGPSVLVGAVGVDLLGPLGVPLCFALLVGGHGPTPVGRLRALLGRLRPALGHLCEPVRLDTGLLGLGAIAVGLRLLLVGPRSLPVG